ncbi:hypothetical protein HDV00_000652 [Rhizophlyctis rosea]|nr:hypothetical protein HDV00_000652 [Rhizophlyctis rosea]
MSRQLSRGYATAAGGFPSSKGTSAAKIAWNGYQRAVHRANPEDRKNLIGRVRNWDKLSIPQKNQQIGESWRQRSPEQKADYMPRIAGATDDVGSGVKLGDGPIESRWSPIGMRNMAGGRGTSLDTAVAPRVPNNRVVPKEAETIVEAQPVTTEAKPAEKISRPSLGRRRSIKVTATGEAGPKANSAPELPSSKRTSAAFSPSAPLEATPLPTEAKTSASTSATELKPQPSMTLSEWAQAHAQNAPTNSPVLPRQSLPAQDLTPPVPTKIPQMTTTSNDTNIPTPSRFGSIREYPKKYQAGGAPAPKAIKPVSVESSSTSTQSPSTLPPWLVSALAESTPATKDPDPMLGAATDCSLPPWMVAPSYPSPKTKTEKHTSAKEVVIEPPPPIVTKPITATEKNIPQRVEVKRAVKPEMKMYVVKKNMRYRVPRRIVEFVSERNGRWDVAKEQADAVMENRGKENVALEVQSPPVTQLALLDQLDDQVAAMLLEARKPEVEVEEPALVMGDVGVTFVEETAGPSAHPDTTTATSSPQKHPDFAWLPAWMLSNPDVAAVVLEVNDGLDTSDFLASSADMVPEWVMDFAEKLEAEEEKGVRGGKEVEMSAVDSEVDAQAAQPTTVPAWLTNYVETYNRRRAELIAYVVEKNGRWDLKKDVVDSQPAATISATPSNQPSAAISGTRSPTPPHIRHYIVRKNLHAAPIQKRIISYVVEKNNRYDTSTRLDNAPSFPQSLTPGRRKWLREDLDLLVELRSWGLEWEEVARCLPGRGVRGLMRMHRREVGGKDGVVREVRRWGFQVRQRLRGTRGDLLMRKRKVMKGKLEDEVLEMGNMPYGPVEGLVASVAKDVKSFSTALAVAEPVRSAAVVQVTDAVAPSAVIRVDEAVSPRAVIAVDEAVRADSLRIHQQQEQQPFIIPPSIIAHVNALPTSIAPRTAIPVAIKTPEAIQQRVQRISPSLKMYIVKKNLHAAPIPSRIVKYVVEKNGRWDAKKMETAVEEFRVVEATSSSLEPFIIPAWILDSSATETMARSKNVPVVRRKVEAPKSVARVEVKPDIKMYVVKKNLRAASVRKGVVEYVTEKNRRWEPVAESVEDEIVLDAPESAAVKDGNGAAQVVTKAKQQASPPRVPPHIRHYVVRKNLRAPVRQRVIKYVVEKNARWDQVEKAGEEVKEEVVGGSVEAAPTATNLAKPTPSPRPVPPHIRHYVVRKNIHTAPVPARIKDFVVAQNARWRKAAKISAPVPQRHQIPELSYSSISTPSESQPAIEPVWQDAVQRMQESVIPKWVLEQVRTMVGEHDIEGMRFVVEIGDVRVERVDAGADVEGRDGVKAVGIEEKGKVDVAVMEVGEVVEEKREVASDVTADQTVSLSQVASETPISTRFLREAVAASVKPDVVSEGWMQQELSSLLGARVAKPVSPTRSTSKPLKPFPQPPVQQPAILPLNITTHPITTPHLVHPTPTFSLIPFTAQTVLMPLPQTVPTHLALIDTHIAAATRAEINASHQTVQTPPVSLQQGIVNIVSRSVPSRKMNTPFSSAVSNVSVVRRSVPAGVKKALPKSTPASANQGTPAITTPLTMKPLIPSAPLKPSLPAPTPPPTITTTPTTPTPHNHNVSLSLFSTRLNFNLTLHPHQNGMSATPQQQRWTQRLVPGQKSELELLAGKWGRKVDVKVGGTSWKVGVDVKVFSKM